MKKLENKAAKVIADRDREEFLNHLRQQQETTNKQIHKNMYKHSPVLASVPSYHHYIPPISHTRNVEAEHAKKERDGRSKNEHGRIHRFVYFVWL